MAWSRAVGAEGRPVGSWWARYTDLLTAVFPGVPREIPVCIEEAPSLQI